MVIYCLLHCHCFVSTLSHCHTLSLTYLYRSVYMLFMIMIFYISMPQKLWLYVRKRQYQSVQETLAVTIPLTVVNLSAPSQPLTGSPNRRFLKLHGPAPKGSVLLKVMNPYTTEKREIFFFSDPPHLMKTVRNCWSSTAPTKKKEAQTMYFSRSGCVITMVYSIQYHFSSVILISRSQPAMN